MRYSLAVERNGYDAEFFGKMHRMATQSARVVLPTVLDFVQPSSVIDVGCGTGSWLAELMSLGITDAHGVDGPWVDRQSLQIPSDRFEVADLTQPLRSQRRFDLAMSLEVAEHLPESCADVFVDSLTRLSDTILFSAAVPYQSGTNHINEQWPTYWVKLFMKRHYRTIDCLRPLLWPNTEVEVCYAQNVFFAVSANGLKAWPELARAAERFPDPPRDLVHPRLFVVTTAGAKYPKELLHATLGAIRDKFLIKSKRAEALQRQRAAKWPVDR